MIQDRALDLVKEALHLRMYGECAPGGNETWTDWDRNAEAFLRKTPVLFAPDDGFTLRVSDRECCVLLALIGDDKLTDAQRRDIATLFGVTPERARQIESRLMGRLRAIVSGPRPAATPQ